MVFDVFGTLVDWYTSISERARRIAARAGVELDAERLTVLWRGRYGPALDAVRLRQRPWCDLDQLHRESLAETLAELGVRLAEADQEELVAGWHQLRPWPGVPEALAQLRRLLPVAALSNGHIRLLIDLTRYAGLSFDTLLSAELAGTYKPHPAVYQTAARLLGLAPDRVVLVACHGWDLAGARQAGLRTAHLPRPTEWGPNAPARAVPEADITASDITDLVGRIALLATPASG
ncbi:2-haloacid dehalogenase [Goodfellowiella coeruleoviolacea]|uniref:2-haloacid dehalogenase n=1 Tax=Goodfellowiella coeruleoviolacea TaxID=334858 RepID=A0AAE3G966_9PSEU|nr:2-haloacid dehalogenase [Goodfellowiella coeruleoviolacea]